MRQRGWTAAVIAVTVAAGPVGAVSLRHFSVTQVRQLDVGMPAVRAYLDLADAVGNPIAALPPSGLTATLGEWSVDLTGLEPFDRTEQGVAYVFLVDVSKSLNEELFRQMVSAIESWIADLGPLDRAAVIAFGESSRVVVDFTADRQALLAALRSLGPTDDLTLLHQALTDALDLCRRLDADLPGRRAVVIFSDGKDEGSALEAEDVLAKVRSDPAPIYAIGYSRLRNADERRAFLDLLDRFAANSGGSFFEAQQTRFAEAYQSIRRTIEGVWVADFLCSVCRPDGSLLRLQVTVTLDGQVLSDGGPVRLLPLTQAATPLDEAPLSRPTAEALSPTASSEAPWPVSTDPEDRTAVPAWWWWALIVALVAAAFVAGRTVAARRRAGAPGFAPPATEFPPFSPDEYPRREATVLDPPLPPPLSQLAQQAARKPRKRPEPEARPTPPPPPPRTPPAPTTKHVRLVVVRGSRRGRQYSFTVRDRAVVGKRSDCDCVLTDESAIDPLQFEVIHQSGDLFIRNLSEMHPTLLTGQPIAGKVLITSDSLVGTGETILRIVFH